MTCPSEASSQFATREAFAFDERDSKIHLVGPVAQLDRANGYEPLGREFESHSPQYCQSALAVVINRRKFGQTPKICNYRRIFLSSGGQAGKPS